MRTVLLLIGFILASSHFAEAQQPKKVHRIGYLSALSPTSESSCSEIIRRALRELGYIEGQNISIDYRYVDGKRDRFPELAAELVSLNVDIIVVAGGSATTLAAKNATKTIPIIITGGGSDPVEAGLVKSLASPGGNITGVTNLDRDLGGKRLELFKEAVPKIARVAVLYDPTVRDSVIDVKEVLPGRGSCARFDCSVLGSSRCGRFRKGIRCVKQGTTGRTVRAVRCADAC